MVCYSSHSVLQVQSPLDSQINMKLQNILMLLKRCCNHPYLVEYPLDPATQEFKVTSFLLNCRSADVGCDKFHCCLLPVCIFNLFRSMNSWCKARGSSSYWIECCLHWREEDIRWKSTIELSFFHQIVCLLKGCNLLTRVLKREIIFRHESLSVCLHRVDSSFAVFQSGSYALCLRRRAPRVILALLCLIFFSCGYLTFVL